MRIRGRDIRVMIRVNLGVRSRVGRVGVRVTVRVVLRDIIRIG